MRSMEAGGEFGGLAVAWVVFGSSGALFGTLPARPFERLAACRTGHARRSVAYRTYKLLPLLD